MNNTQHTHGPWRVVPTNSPNDAPGQYSDFEIEHDCGEMGVITIAHIDGEPKEAEANAHLIAAAPDMYEALEKIQLAYEDYIKGDAHWDDGFEQFIARALAKAKGEQV